MIGSKSSSRPCTACNGTRKVSVQVSAGVVKKVDCPACAGSGKSQLITK